MRMKLVVMLALVAVLAVMVAAPVMAERPLRGPLDTHFNLGFGNEMTPCPDITWAGTVQFGDEVYGLAWSPTSGLKEAGGSLHLAEERWMIYEEPFAFEGEDVFTECADEENAVVMSGYDKGVESLANLHAVGNGRVDWVHPDGPFDEALEGRNTHFSGVVSDDLLHFPGTFRINR
jgi:hypothetical protein